MCDGREIDSIVKWVWLTLGWFFFALGVIGIFLPLLPTTPFLILTALCFSRGSATLHRWLLAQPHFGQTLRDWETNGVVRPKAKRAATLAISLLFSLTLGFVQVALWIKAVVAAIGVGVLIFIWTRPSQPNASQKFSSNSPQNEPPK